MPRSIYSEAHAAVRFFGESFDPLVATQILRLPPDYTHGVGEPRLSRTKAGRIVEQAPHRNGMWSMSSRGLVSSAKLVTHVEWLLGQLEPRAEAVRLLLSSGVPGDIFAFSRGSTAIPPSVPRQLRQRASALGLEIVTDHYEAAPGDEQSA